ncbi:MAG: thioesterase domain-containing protein [Ruminococcus sp.]|nr:thioesterase domain-containing protein [Ruminococcus sp.]
MILFCISYAGGSANIYNKWKNIIEDVKIVPIELSGHGSRLKDKLYSNFDEAVLDIYSYIEEYLSSNSNVEYALFGHSMGSWIVFEVAKLLFNNKSIKNKPLHLFFSGNCSPECKDYDVDISSMSDEEFKQMIINYGGVSSEVLAYPEVFNFFLPILRSDYNILNEYKPTDTDFSFDCDISVMNGTKDEFSLDSINAWSKYAGRNFRINSFNDGHFFINSKSREVFKCVCNDLNIKNRNIYERII